MCNHRVTRSDLCKSVSLMLATFLSGYFVFGYPPGSKLFNQGAYFAALVACLLMFIEVGRMVQVWLRKQALY